MLERQRLSMYVGAFVLAALSALALAILSLSSQQGVFKDRYRLVAYYDNVQGLIANAPVWLAGTQVGRVESVELGMRENGEPAVKVVLQVDEDVQSRIRTDSQASIGTIGLLGDRYVEISLGMPSAEPLEEGSEIRTVSPANLTRVIDQGAVALDNIAKLTGNLNDVVAEFDRTSGGKGLAESVSAVAAMVQQIQDGHGLLHSLIYDDYEGSGVESIESALASLEDILQEVEKGEGLLHSFIYDPEGGARLNSILAKIDGGEGTLGLLVNDPTLYDDLKRLVGGAERNTVVRTLIRMSADEKK